jgi:hypothetical protein
MDENMRHGTQTYRSGLVGLLVSVTLAGCLSDSVDAPEVSNTPPPPGSNTAPEISGNPPRVVKIGVEYSFTPQASDADGDPLSFGINNKPTWLTFSATNGRISGVPLMGNEGTYNDIEISVSDGKTSTTLPRFSISVEPSSTSNMPPEIDGTPATNVTVGDTYNFKPTSWDPDGDPLTFSVQNKPSWATFSSSTGQLSGTPQAGDEGAYTNIAITVSDNVETASLPAFSISVNGASTVETIVDNLDANTVQSGTWTDSGNADPYLSNSVWCHTGCLFTWMPDLPTSGTYEVYAYWTYHPGRTTTASYQIDHDGGTDTTVVNQRDSSLSSQWYLVGTYELTAGVNGDVSLSYDESEPDVSVLADAVRYVLINAGPDSVPPTDPTGLGATASGSSEIELAWTPSTDDVVVAGYLVYQDGNFTTPIAVSTTTSYSVLGLAPNTSYTFAVTAFDLAGNESNPSDVATATTLEAAANSPPQISGTPSPMVNVGQSYSFTPTATDPDDDNLTFSIQNSPGWASFNSSTGQLSGTPQPGDEGDYTNISISVSDGELSDSLPSFTVTVNQISLGSAELSWTPPTQNTDGSVLMDLAGFKIYYGTSPGNYPNQITINNPGITTYVVENLTPNTWYFVSTAFNSSAEESDFSNIATKTIN